MTGQEIGDSGRTKGFDLGKPVLELRNLSKRGNYRDISFSLQAGEILGITGLLGSGRTELALSLFGMNPPDSGEIVVDGERAVLGSNQDAIARGIGYLPEDRLNLGLVMDQPVSDNLILTILDKLLNRLKLIDEGRRRSVVSRGIDDLHIRVSDPEDPVNTLSGGNQQRVVLAKWLATRPRVLILDSPTVGVDVAAKVGIYEIVRRLASQHMGIILISDEVTEVLQSCHRILVMRRGRLVGEHLSRETSEKALSQSVHEG
jgi:simple sugar transport system ATP-binding protein